MDINNFSSIITSTEGAIKELQGINYNEVKRFSDEISTKFKEFKEGGQALINEGKILKIGVVGQVKAGKSSFLNSLMFNGEDVLPKASTPMTAGLTILEYGESNFFEVEYYDEKEWNEFVDTLLPLCYYPVDISKLFDFEMMDDFLESGQIWNGTTNCGRGETHMYIQSNFNVLPCTCIPNSVGNLLEDNIGNIKERLAKSNDIVVSK